MTTGAIFLQLSHSFCFSMLLLWEEIIWYWIYQAFQNTKLTT